MNIPTDGQRDGMFGPWLRTILTRRPASAFCDDGPTDGELDAILAAAVTVTDESAHRPWRFTIIRGAARLHFADLVRTAARAAGDHPAGDGARRSIRAAPTVIAIVARGGAGGLGRFEARDSAARAAYVISLAAHELGLGSRWQAAPRADHLALRTALSMSKDDTLVGWVELGRVSLSEELETARSIPLSDVVQVMADDGSTEPYGRPPRTARRRQRVC